MQVSQTEQASIQAAFRLISSLSGMYAPLYFTNHYFNVDWTGWQVITFAFVGYSLHTAKVVLYVRWPRLPSQVLLNARAVTQFCVYACFPVLTDPVPDISRGPLHFVPQ